MRLFYKPALPERYMSESARFGVVGAIAIECSPLKSDNQWVLNVAADHPVIVGVVGDLVPGAPGYRADLERLTGNPLFLGIRYGNLWGCDLAADIGNPGFVDGLQALAAAGLVLDSANPDPRLIGAIRVASERVPDLRIVIDHLPRAPVPVEPAARDAYWADLRALAQNPNVFVKLSGFRAPERKTRDRSAFLSGAARCPLGCLWRGPCSLRQRLAEQRSCRLLRADLCHRARLYGAQERRGAREILLEELRRRLPVEAETAGSAPPVTARAAGSRSGFVSGHGFSRAENNAR